MASKPVTGTTSDCPVCKGTLRKPVTLKCHHQLCAGCLQQHVSALAETDIFHCPTCNSENKLPEGGVEELRVAQSSPKDGQAAATQGGDSSHSTSLCTNSEHGPATVFCVDCEEFYCNNCASYHAHIKITRDHNMTPVATMTADDVTQALSAHMKSTCEKHHLPLNILCKDCQQPICTTCTVFDHKKHWYKELAKSAGEVQEELKHVIVQTVEYMAKQEEVLTDMRTTKKNICTSVQVAKQSVEQAADQMCDIINNYKRELVRDLESHEVETLQKLDSIEKDAEDNKAAATKKKKVPTGLCQSGKTIDKVMRAPAIQKKFALRNRSTQQNMTWKYVSEHNKQTEESLKAMFGNVKLKTPSVIRPGRITLGDHIHQVPLKYVGKTIVTGLVVIGDCLCVTHREDPNLWLYDIVSGDNKTCKVPELQDPRGMALVKSTDLTLVITDQSNDGGKLHFVKITTDLDITHHRVKNIPVKQPRAISVSRDTGELLIGQQDSSQCVICDEEGDVKRQVTVADAGSGCFPWCVTETRDGFAALVWDKEGNSTIQWFDQDGKGSHTYGCNDGEQIKCGLHMVIDSEGRLIVVDYINNRLHLVDTNGQLSQFLLTKDDGIKYPHCVYLDEASSRLYVALGLVGSVEVRVYRWSPEPGDCHTTNFELELNIVKF